MDLFPAEQVVGLFRGFRGAPLEFHADLTLPYRDDMNAIPLHGQFVLVELSTPSEAILGRITSVISDGPLTEPDGDDYGLRALAERRTVPDEVRSRYVRYRADVRLLGVVKADGRELAFAPSHRRLPHVGARVAFPGDDILREVAGGSRHGGVVGHFALGEFVYCGDDARRERWITPTRPPVPVRFAASQLVARRSFVFARAGFGKSNLIKLLLARLYGGPPPTVRLRMGRKAPVGTVVFDPDGEYYWPDANGRPGLCDVDHLSDRIVVFTPRAAPSAFYGSFRAAGVKLDLRDLPPALVLSIALGAAQQEHQNVRKLKALRGDEWREAVDEIHRNGNSSDGRVLRAKLRLGPQQESELLAARANLTQVVQMLHEPGSATLPLLLEALAEGKLCVVDISQMRGSVGLALSAVVLRYIFDRNQEEFTKAEPRPIATIAVVEEAQAVLSGGAGAETYETWVKEGRKYNLGALLVTQQPGSIPAELLSQGDNWFVFHLLSAADLAALKAANAHFSDDLLSSLLNEPLPGNGVFWSSVAGDTDRAGNAYPIPLRVLSFEAAFAARDLDGARGRADTYASRLAAGCETTSDELRRAAIDRLRREARAHGWFTDRRPAVPWMAVEAALRRALPQRGVPDHQAWARAFAPAALDEMLGPRGWTTERRPKRDDASRSVTWVRRVPEAAPARPTAQPDRA